ncbi:MAG: hypothetical protein F6K39_18780 [Okeania sp. SIO3B3]|nr:hypothetical protein [Okeania sp. SIO3B3]
MTHGDLVAWLVLGESILDWFLASKSNALRSLSLAVIDLLKRFSSSETVSLLIDF